MSDLETLFPTPVLVPIGGMTVEVLPMRMERLVQFQRAIQPAAPLLMSGQLQAAIDQHYESIRKAVSTATDLPEARFAEFWGDEFLNLLAAVMEANLDFFVRRLLPAVERLVKVTGAMRPDLRRASPPGTSSSPPGSAAGDTALPTSAG